MKVTIAVEGMMKSKSGATWMSWPASVSAALSELASVKDVHVNLETDEFTVVYERESVSVTQMLEAIRELGYKPKVVPSQPRINLAGKTTKSDWVMPPALVAAFLEADQSHKLVFVDFHAEWCGACKALEKTVFVDPAFKQAMQHFVFLKIDTDLYPETAKHFKVIGMPTLLVIDITGQEIYRHVGPISAAALVESLQGLP